MFVGKKDPYTIYIRDDFDCDSPRNGDGLFGTMVCFHRHYNLGDAHAYPAPDDFLNALLAQTLNSDDEARRVRERNEEKYDADAIGWPAYYKAIHDGMLDVIERKYVILPLYLYDHSGITMNTTGFSCPWDSVQVGWIYVAREDILKEFGGKLLTESKRDQAKQLLKSEVNVYDRYIRGECYGFELYKNGNLEDSCWGFIGEIDEVKGSIKEYLPPGCEGILDKLEEYYGEPEIEEELEIVG